MISGIPVAALRSTPLEFALVSIPTGTWSWMAHGQLPKYNHEDNLRSRRSPGSRRFSEDTSLVPEQNLHLVCQELDLQKLL